MTPAVPLRFHEIARRLYKHTTDIRQNGGVKGLCLNLVCELVQYLILGSVAENERL